jgi:nitroimidazol reductase NimA-like FMN-containing flavoprotein (pyridoxamine 5'-phosphate oxidase superfamily)
LIKWYLPGSIYSNHLLTIKITNMLGKLTSVEIEEVIQHQVVGRIGCHANGMTYVVPVSYAYDGDYIYVRTFEGLKVDMMRKNPKVCFEIDTMHNMGNWESVIAWGDFEELHEASGRKEALQKLMDRALPFISSETTHLTPQWPFPSSNPGNIEGIVFRIKLTDKTGRYERMEPASVFAT